VECDGGRKLFANKEILGFALIYPGEKKSKNHKLQMYIIFHSQL